MRIDSLCLLLERKGQLLDTVMHTFSRFRSVGEIINRKIPMIASRARDDRTLVGVKEEIPEEKFLVLPQTQEEKIRLFGTERKTGTAASSGNGPADFNCRYAVFSEQGTDRQAGD